MFIDHNTSQHFHKFTTVLHQIHYLLLGLHCISHIHKTKNKAVNINHNICIVCEQLLQVPGMYRKSQLWFYMPTKCLYLTLIWVTM